MYLSHKALLPESESFKAEADEHIVKFKSS